MLIRSWKSLLVWSGIAASVFSCANVVRPSGGERDSKGPGLIGVVPYPGARNFMGREVTFYFDEFLKPGSYANEVFISPVPKVRPEVLVHNKRLTVRFQEELRENTTYVITLGKEIKDFNEGNKLEESFTYAFSTGDILDTLQFKGRVKNSYTGQGEDALTVMLFPENEIVGDSILGVRPVYAIETDTDGGFSFKYLKAGRYKIYGVRDVDNDFSYSQVKESIALAENPLVELTDTMIGFPEVNLTSFTIDNEGPTVKGARWANDYTLHVEFGEEIRDSFEGRTFEIEMKDTAGGQGVVVEGGRFRRNDHKHLYLNSPRPRKQSWDLAFRNVMDSLGQSVDTTLRVTQVATYKEDQKRYFEQPYFEPERSTLVLPSTFILPDSLNAMWIQLADSNENAPAYSLVSNGLSAEIVLSELPDHGQTYRIKVDSTLPFPDGKLLDTNLVFQFKFPDPGQFGSVSGNIVGDSSKPEMRYVVLVTGAVAPVAAEKGTKAEKPKPWMRKLYGPGAYRLEYVPAGTYTITIIEDRDGNGTLTPGSLVPYRLPEQMIVDVPKLDVKANLEMANYDIHVVPAKTEGKGKLDGTESDGTGVVPGTGMPSGGKGSKKLK